LALLSKVFQNKFVDVTTIGSIVRTEITRIRMLFIVKPTHLNATTFNENRSYHVIPQYGPVEGHLRKSLSSEIHGKCIMVLKWIGIRWYICIGLDGRFVDNDLISCFKILNPTNMSLKQIGL